LNLLDNLSLMAGRGEGFGLGLEPESGYRRRP